MEHPKKIFKKISVRSKACGCHGNQDISFLPNFDQFWTFFTHFNATHMLSLGDLAMMRLMLCFGVPLGIIWYGHELVAMASQ